MITEAHIRPFFEQNYGIASIQSLLDKGVSYHDINKLLADARLVKLKRGVYKWAEMETNELVEVSFMIPNSVFCLQTACFFYDLTTSIPSEIHVAIAGDRRVALPNYPPVKLYYWNDMPLKLGVTTVLVDNQPIQIYDIEKTICDVIRHRQKLGFEVLKEILKNYLNRSDRDLNRLGQYAQQLNIQNKVEDFIKILL